MNLNELDELYRKQRANYPEPFRLRIHRTLSWLQRANLFVETDVHSKFESETLEKQDWDFGFLSQWIAFNAIYARDLSLLRTSQDRVDFRQFISTICQFDNQKQIYDLVWQTFSSEIRALVNNRYVFQPFWDFHNNLISENEFNQSFQSAKKRVNDALAEQNTVILLEIVFDRLYTLRNQIVHGGATWNSSANRQQVQSACKFLNKILPVFLEIMMLNPNRDDWGKPFYPFVKDE